jgi:hypothetical protein
MSTLTNSVKEDDSVSPITDDSWDAYNRGACGLHYIAHKMREMEIALQNAVKNAKGLDWADHNSVFNYASHRKSEATLVLATRAQ